MPLGHGGYIMKVCFNQQGTKILTASGDFTAKVWSAETGELIQTLTGTYYIFLVIYGINHLDHLLFVL